MDGSDVIFSVYDMAVNLFCVTDFYFKYVKRQFDFLF